MELANLTHARQADDTTRSGEHPHGGSLVAIGELRVQTRSRGGATPLTLALTWSTTRSTTRRAASPRPRRCEFNDGGTPAVEVGTGRDSSTASTWPDGSVAAGWGGGQRRRTVGSGQGCAIANTGGGTPMSGPSTASRSPGARPSTRPRRWTPHGDLYFGAGNAASPVDGGYYAYTTDGTEVWNQVVTNPSTDTAPDGGVQASLSIGDGGSLGRGRLAGPDDLRAEQRERRSRPRLAAVLRRQRVLHRRRGRPLRHRDRTTSSPAARPPPASPTARTTPTADTLRIYNDHGGLICSATTERGDRLLPRRRPHPPRRGLRDRHRHGQLLPRRQRREHGQGLRHQVQPGVERPRWTAPPGAAPRWPTFRATASSPWSRAPSRGRQRIGLGPQRGHGRRHLARPTSLGAVYGSVTTADLTGSGYQDVIVPTTRASRSSTARPAQTVAALRRRSPATRRPRTRDTGSRTPRSSPPTPTGRSASRWPATSPSGQHSDVQGIVQHFEVTGSKRRPGRRGRRVAPVPPRRRS